MSGSGTARILDLAKLLRAKSDSSHGLTLPQIQQYLQDDGITVERKALYRDFKTLHAMGFVIEKLPTRPVSYYAASRLFSPTELSLIRDAIATSKTISEKDAEDLIARLFTLTSEHIAEELGEHMGGTSSTQDRDDMLDLVELLHKAIDEHLDISFAYRKYDATGKQVDVMSLSDGKARRRKTPLFLIYDRGKYYLLVFDEQAPDHIRVYRVDRMHNVMLLDEADKAHKVAPDFDINEYRRMTLGMFADEPVVIWLAVSEPMIESIVDLFGKDNATIAGPDDGIEGDKTWVKIRIRAAATPVLFGQLAQFGKEVKVTAPSSVVRAYSDHLKEALEAQLD